MAIRHTLAVRGLSELDRALGELPRRAARAVLQRVAVRALQPMADAARQRAPTRFFDLVRSITVTAQKPDGADAGKAAFARTMREGGTRSEAAAALRGARADATFAEAFMGPGRHPQASMQEFGTQHHAPQPYMRPAFDAEAARALEIIRAELGAEIAKSARRIANRQRR